MDYDEYQIEIAVKGRNNDNNYYSHPVAEFTIGETTEQEAMEVLRAAARFYLGQFEKTVTPGAGA